MKSLLRAGIVGVSGYSGVELAKILSRHPGFRLTLAVSDRWAGRPVGRFVAIGGDAAAVNVLSQEEGQKHFGDVDVLFLCTPHEASIALAPRALEAGTRVVDLSGGFRLPASDYPSWYGFEHGNAGLLTEALYSMPEATGVDPRLRQARLIANPGCYVTASTLALLPMLRAGLVEPGTLIVDGKSGTTGAGRKATEDMSLSEAGENIRAYRVGRHQHTPEIERALGMAGVPGARVLFTPHLLPVRRGILATAYGRLTQAALAGDANAAAQKALETFAEGKPFVRVVAAEEVTLHAVVGTNRVVLGAKADPSRGVLIVLSAIDNLVKGAAGQAVQNANLMFGLPETEGLLDLPGHMP